MAVVEVNSPRQPLACTVAGEISAGKALPSIVTTRINGKDRQSLHSGGGGATNETTYIQRSRIGLRVTRSNFHSSALSNSCLRPAEAVVMAWRTSNGGFGSSSLHSG